MSESLTSIFRHFISLSFVCLMIIVLIIKTIFLFSLLSVGSATIGSLLVFVVLIFGIVYKKRVRLLGRRVFEKIEIQKNYKRIILYVFLLSIVLKIAIVYTFQINSLIHPDIKAYVVSAVELCSKGFVEEYGSYCMDFPHMFWFSIFLSPIVCLFGTNNIALSMYLIVISTCSSFLICDIVARRYSKEHAVLFSLAVCFLPSQLLAPGYIIHEHALIFYMSLSAWLLFGLHPFERIKWKQNAFLLLGLLSLAFSVQVNKAAYIGVIAYLILFLVEKNPSKISQKVFRIALLLLVITLVAQSCSIYQLKHTKLKESYISGDSVLWTLYVGGNPETKGQWNETDMIEFNKYNELKQEDVIREIRKDMVLNRYKYLMDNPATLFELLFNKMTTIWSCLTYPISYSNETISKTETREFYNKYLFKGLVCIEYGFSVLFLIIFFSNLFLSKNRVCDDFYRFSMLFTIGCTFLFLITECNNKYTYSIQLFFIVSSLFFGENWQGVNTKQ